ncbi:MAG: DUF4238 domain-containing protein [Verrucomicrobiia bacterium]
MPQFYLRQWSRDGEHIWAYPKTARNPIGTTIANVACESGLYSTPTVQPGESFSAEEEDLSRIESIHAKVWPEIFDRAANSETRRNLAIFLALLFLRHPTRKSDIGRIRDEIREAVSHLSPETQIEVSVKERTGEFSVGEILRHTDGNQNAISSAFIDCMHSGLDMVANALFERPWGVLCSERPMFLTSDSPITLWRGTATKENLGLRIRGTEVTFPISPTRLLVIADYWPHEFALYPVESADDFNSGLVHGATRFLFADSRSDDLQSSIARWRSVPKPCAAFYILKPQPTIAKVSWP